MHLSQQVSLIEILFHKRVHAASYNLGKQIRAFLVN